MELDVVAEDGIANAATFLKDVSVGFRVITVPPQLRLIEFARTTNSGQAHPCGPPVLWTREEETTSAMFLQHALSMLILHLMQYCQYVPVQHLLQIISGGYWIQVGETHPDLTVMEGCRGHTVCPKQTAESSVGD